MRTVFSLLKKTLANIYDQFFSAILINSTEKDVKGPTSHVQTISLLEINKHEGNDVIFLERNVSKQ